MKKSMWLLWSACLAGVAAVWIWTGRSVGETEEKEKHAIRLGILLYQGDDTFIGNVRQALEEQAKRYEQETGIKVVLNIEDAKENQNTQSRTASVQKPAS